MAKSMNNSFEKVLLTASGLAQLVSELERLKKERRPQVVERLASARGQGDLAENSDYTDAKQELAMIDSRIFELEEVVASSVLIKNENNGNGQSLVSIGSQVTVEIEGEKIDYQLVGEWEADPVARKISDKSPLGKSLLGKGVGDEIEVEAPVGKVVYRIVKVA